MGVQEDSTQLVQVDFEVFGHVQGEQISCNYVWDYCIFKKKCLPIFSIHK